MSVSYPIAALRHVRDAELLSQSERPANADQLFGLAAECAIKAVLESEGVSLTKGSPYFTHVDSLWPLAAAWLTGRAGGRRTLGGEPFADWRVDQRYDAGPPPEGARARHREAAQVALRVLDGALLDGRLR